MLRQHHVLRNLRKNRDVVITKPNKGNGVVILHRKLYDNAFQEIISDTSKFKIFNEDPTLKCEASFQRFLGKLKQENIFNENIYDVYPPGSVLARLLLKCTNFPHDTFPERRPLFYRYLLLIIILPVPCMIFFHPENLMIALAKLLFLFFLKLKIQIFPVKFLFPTM